MKLRLGVAFAVLFFATATHADTYTVVGQTNYASCASVDAYCSPESFALNLVAQDEAGAYQGTGVEPVVLSLTGEINGIAVTGSGGVLYQNGSSFGPPLVPIDFTTATGLQGQFIISYMLPCCGNVALSYLPTPAAVAYVNWDIVQTPEPPLFWYLCASIVGLLLFRRYVWAG